VEVAPALPAVVVLDVEPYYYHSGYYYYYHNDSWGYSKARGGPWRDLPRSRWPKETRHKGHHDRGHERGDGEHRYGH
jgi:hypothetical protein